MLSARKAIRNSRSGVHDGKLSIEDIEAAFTTAGLEQDYQTLVAALGESTLAETMTRRWLDLTIRDLLADRARGDANGRELARRDVAVSA